MLKHVSAVNTTIFRSLPLTGCYFMGGICKKYRGIVLNNKISGIKLVFSLLNNKDDARSHKHKIHYLIRFL